MLLFLFHFFRFTLFLTGASPNSGVSLSTVWWLEKTFPRSHSISEPNNHKVGKPKKWVGNILFVSWAQHIWWSYRLALHGFFFLMFWLWTPYKASTLLIFGEISLRFLRIHIVIATQCFHGPNFKLDSFDDLNKGSSAELWNSWSGGWFNLSSFLQRGEKSTSFLTNFRFWGYIESIWIHEA